MKHTLSGFSLTELAIVMAIMGVLAGGVIGGQKLIDTSRMNRIISDAERFQKAALEFEKRYGALPGDITNATQLFPNAIPAAVNGNGDRMINSSGVGPTGNEDLQFWRHLQLAGLLDVSNFDGTSRFQPGAGVAAGNLDGTGYKVRNTADGLVFELAGFSTAGSGNDSLPALRVDQAAGLDKRFDDGNPATGTIRSLGADCLGGGGYNMTADGPVCRLQILVERSLTPVAAAGAVGNCGGQPLGTVRPSAATCPNGSKGNVVEICLASGWQTRYQCEISSCPTEDGKKAFTGDTRSIHCPVGQEGSRIEKCKENGSWETIADNCCLTRTIEACQAGFNGTVTQRRCPPAGWTNISDTCVPAALTCDDAGTPRPIGFDRTVPGGCASGVGTHTERCTDNGNGTTSWQPTGAMNCSCVDTAHPGSPWPPGYTSTANACVTNVSAGIFTFTCQNDGSWKATGNCCQLIRRQIQGSCPATQKQMQISNHLGVWTSYGGCIAKNPGPAATCIDGGNTWWETTFQCKPLGAPPSCTVTAPNFANPSAAIFTPLQPYP